MKFKKARNIVGAVLIVVFGVCFFLASIPFIYGIRNIGMIVPMMIFLALTLALAVCPFFRRYKSRVLRVIDDMILIGALLFAALMAVVSLIMCFGFQRADSQNVSVVIVPGAKIHSDVPSVMLRSRLGKAVELLEKNENAVCIVSGGQGADEQYSEAYVMKNYLKEQGVAEKRIYTEDQSVNTKQNFINSAEIIKNNSLSGNIAITTDFYHSYRCVYYAKQAGLSALAYPCSTEKYLLPAQWFREVFAVVKALVFD